MAIGDISLTSAARQNLLSLQNTSSLLEQTQLRLASGKKVNSALDDATSFFSSQGFINSANDLDGLKNGMSTSIQNLQAASNAIESITNVVKQMQGLTNSALQTTDSAIQTSLAEQFNALRTQIDNLVGDSIFNGTNLLNSTSTTLTVTFSADNASSNLVISAVDVRSDGLGIAAAGNDWGSAGDIQTSQSMLTTALATLRSESSTFGSNSTILNTRLDFTSNMITTLQTASDNLVLADTNEEGANLQALQAQSQLGIVALGISGSQASAILRLF